MEEAQSIAILVVAATSFWAFIALKKRIEFLEHEVRWLRSDLFGLDAGIVERWEGPNGRPEKPSQEASRKRSTASREPAGAK